MYGLRVVTGPTAEPITLAEARAQCRIEQTLEDASFAAYILSARQYLEAITGRAFLTQTLELTFDDFPAWEIELPRGPVASITSINYLDTAGATQPVTSYTLDGQSWPARLTPAFGATWPQTRGTAGCVAVRFVAGEAQAPAPIRQAMLLAVAHWNEHREAPTDNPAIHALVAPYRMNWF